MQGRQFLTGLFLCIGMTAVAQTDRKLDTVQVSASRRVQPVSVQGLSREDFLRQGITDLTDAVGRMSGVNIRDYGGAGGMKTLSVHSMGATHTGVVYDGVAVSDCESGQTDLSRFSLEQVDSIALTVGDPANIFTPARQLASAAALYLVKRAPRTDSLAMRFTGGSFGLAQTSLDGMLAMRHGWSARVQGEFMRADNMYPFTLANHALQTREKRGNNAINRGFSEVNVYHESGWMLKLYYCEANKQLPGQVVYYNPVAHNRDRFRNAFAQLRWQKTVGRVTLQANAKGGWSRERYYEYNMSYVRHDSTRVYDQAEAYLSLTGLYSICRRLDASLAADYSFQQLKSRSLDCLRPHRHAALEALRLRWRDKHLTATASLLMSSYINKVDDVRAASNCHRLSPSASVAFTPLSWLVAKAYYKDIFRPATFNDNYYTQIGSRNLSPEKARTLGWGLDFSLKHECVQLEAYRAWIDDKIVAMPVNAFFWNMVNVGKVGIWGFEARAKGSARLARWLTLEHNVSYTFQQAENVTDPSYRYYRNQIAYTPRHTAGGSVGVLTPWVCIAASGNGMTERWSTNSNLPASHIPGHVVWNMSAWHSFRLLTLRAEMLNISDRQYDIVRLYPMPGRSFKTTVTLTL